MGAGVPRTLTLPCKARCVYFDFALHNRSASPHSYFSTRSSHLRHRASDSVHPEMWFAATLHREWGRAKLPGTPNLEPRAYLTPYTLLPKPYTLHDVP